MKWYQDALFSALLLELHPDVTSMEDWIHAELAEPADDFAAKHGTRHAAVRGLLEAARLRFLETP
jgi:hypothetical protein